MDALIAYLVCFFGMTLLFFMFADPDYPEHTIVRAVLGATAICFILWLVGFFE